MALPLPRTLSDYRDCIEASTKFAFSIASGKNFAMSYSWLWVVRAHLLTEMHVGNVKRLAVGPHDTLETLKVSFPDQCDWLPKFASATDSQSSSRYLGGVKVSSFLKDLQYTQHVVGGRPHHRTDIAG